MLLKTLQVVVPEPLVVRDPVPHGAEPLGGEAIAALPAVPLLGHETGVEQDAEVLGDGRAAHFELSRDRVDWAVALGEEIEQPATRGMADRSKDLGSALGSHHHAAIIRKKMLTCQAFVVSLQQGHGVRRRGVWGRRSQDEPDFLALLPQLSKGRREWLREAVSRVYDGSIRGWGGYEPSPPGPSPVGTGGGKLISG